MKFIVDYKVINSYEFEIEAESQEEAESIANSMEQGDIPTRWHEDEAIIEVFEK